MSVISTWEAIPGRVYSMFNYLLGKGKRGAEKETTTALFFPPLKQIEPGETESMTMFKAVLNEAKKLGLVQEEDRLSVPDELAERAKKSMKSSWDFFAGEMQEILLDDSRAEERSQNSVPFALSWLLMQNPADAPLFRDGQKEKVLSQLPDAGEVFELNAAADFQNLAYWGRFLGCCVWFQTKAQTQIIPDPSAVISRLLPEIFRGTDTMLISRFLSEVGRRRPALEGGTVFQKLLNWSVEEFRPEGKSLLKSTSFALVRLEQRKLIKLQNLSDAEAVTVFMNGTDRRMSHIEFKKR